MRRQAAVVLGIDKDCSDHYAQTIHRMLSEDFPTVHVVVIKGATSIAFEYDALEEHEVVPPGPPPANDGIRINGHHMNNQETAS